MRTGKSRIQEIQRANRLQKQKNDELRGRIEAVEAASREIREDERQAYLDFTAEREAVLEQKKEIQTALERAADKTNRTRSCVSEIKDRQSRILKTYLEANTGTMALKEQRKTGQKEAPYIIERNKLRSAAMACFLNPHYHLVQEDAIRKEAERFCITFPDDWLPFVLLSVTAEEPVREKSLQQAYEVLPEAVCLFMAIWHAANSRKTPQDPAGLGDSGLWIQRLGVLLIAKTDRFQTYLPTDEEDIQIFEAYLILYAVLARRMQRVENRYISEIRKDAELILQKCMQAEGLDRTSAAHMLQDQYQRQLSHQDRDLPVWDQASYFTEMDTYCTAYAELSGVLALASGSRRIYDEYVCREDISDAELMEVLHDLLKKLILLPSAREKENSYTLRSLELLAAFNGREEEAEKAHQEEIRRSGVFHIISHFSEVICGSGKDGKSIVPGLRACLTELLMNTEKDAARSYVEEYRSKYRETWPVRIFSYNAEVDFSKSMADIERDAEDYYQVLIAKNNALTAGRGGGYLPALLCGVLAILTGGMLLYSEAGNLAIVLSVSLFSAASFLALFHHRSVEMQNCELEDTCEKVQYILRVLYVEFEGIRDFYMQYDKYGDKLLDL